MDIKEYKLPVKDVLIEAFSVLYLNYKDLLSVLVFALMVTIGFSIYDVMLEGNTHWLLTIIVGMVDIYIAIIIHRTAIEGVDILQRAVYFRFGARELNYLVMTIAITICLFYWRHCIF